MCVKKKRSRKDEGRKKGRNRGKGKKAGKGIGGVVGGRGARVEKQEKEKVAQRGAGGSFSLDIRVRFSHNRYGNLA